MILTLVVGEGGPLKTQVRAAQQLTQQDAAKDIAKEMALKREIESLKAHVSGLLAELRKHQGIQVEQHKVDQVL